MTRASATNSPLYVIRDFIQEINLTNVVNVTSALLRRAVLEAMKEFIQMRNLSKVVNVRNALLIKAVLEHIKEFMQEKIFFKSIKYDKYVTWEYDLRIHETIHTTEKPYK